MTHAASQPGSLPSVPPPLLGWLVGVSTLGLGVVVSVAAWPGALSATVLTWAVAGLVASAHSIPIPGTTVRVSAETPFLMTLLGLGATREAVLAAGLSQLIACVASGTARAQPYTLPFNVSVGLISALVGVWALSLPLAWPAPLLAAAFATSTTGAILVAFAIRIAGGSWPGRPWRQTMWLTTAAHLASASLAAILAHLPTVLTTVLLVGPIVVLLGSAYRIHGERVAEQVARRRERREVFLPALQALVEAIEARDERAHGHNRRVRAYALGVAGQLGLRDETLLSALDYGALLHDVGRIAIPDELVFARRPLTAEEHARVRRHVEIGAELIRHVPFPEGVLHAVRHHHEQWGGAGYPDGLAGEDIPLVARIVSVCDAFDDLRTGGGWRDPLDRDDALERLERDAGTHFDPAIVAALVEWQHTFDHTEARPSGVSPVSAEIRAVAREQARLSDLAHNDELTGLANGRALRRDLAAAADGGVLLMLDLDGFKGINDHLGHQAGDEALRLVGDALAALGSHDLACYRNGGDEFVVLARGPEEPAALAARVRQAVEACCLPVPPDGEVPLRTSVGAVRIRPGEAPEEALHRADEAMYAVKRARKAADANRGDAPRIRPRAH